MNAASCPCGEPGTHDVAHRRTYDGRGVILWSDGDLTFAFSGIPGIGKLRDVERARRVGRLVIDDVCIFTADELPLLIQVARKLPAGALPGDLRAAFRAAGAPSWRLPGRWVTYAADHDGTPTCRVWVFPRLGPYARVAIWHERGVYEVMNIDTAKRTHRDQDRYVYASTGFKSRNLRDAFKAVRFVTGASLG